MVGRLQIAFTNSKARHWSCQRPGYASTRMAKE